MLVCMYVFRYAYMSAYIHVCMRTHTHTHTRAVPEGLCLGFLGVWDFEKYWDAPVISSEP